MKTLQDDLKLEQPLDLTLFWQTAAQLPARPNATRSTHAILRCRYNSNGSRSRTFDQMAHDLGVTRTRAAELVRRALQRMRAYKAQFVLHPTAPEDNPETCWVFEIHNTEPSTIARYRGRLPVTDAAWAALGIDRRAHYVDAILTPPALWEILHTLPILEAPDGR